MNTFRTAALLTALTLIFVFGGAALGGKSGMIMAFILALGMNFFSYFYSDKLVLNMYGAKEISEAEAGWLYQTIRELTSKAGIPMPKVYMIPTDQPNAFATGRNPGHAAVAVTQGIMRTLNREQLAGVLAHEIAHIKNRDILIGTLAATMAGAISMIANMAQWALMFGGHNRDDGEGTHPIVAVVMMLVAPIAAMLVQMAISRQREYLADRTGAELTRNPEGLAGALIKIHEAAAFTPMNAEPATAHLFIMSPLTGQDFATLFSTHPPVEKRVEALRNLHFFS
ncbi:MAG: zinc metalloprotease HtpX [Nitrospinae bacterium]|nr:zinc metalloprotease HtpX [Nitrospinota bacterium]